MKYLKIISIFLGFYVLVFQINVNAQPQYSFKNKKSHSYLCNPNADNCTKLTMKATHLKMHMTKKQIIDLLGKPTWAILPQDKDWGESDIPLTLMWINGECTPISVDFDSQLVATGWDQGRLCYNDNEYKVFSPPDKFKCSNKSRAVYCSSEDE